MTARVENFSLYFVTIVLCYFVAWTASYLFVNGPDFRFYFDYLRLFWKGDGLERPAFAGVVSILLAIPLSAFAIWLIRRRLKRDEKAA